MSRFALLGAVPAVLLLGLLPLSLGQEQEDEATIKVDVEVVNVLATVRDKKGGLVTNLTKDDFILEEDGEPQEIRYFERQTDLPLTIGLLVDTSVSQQRVIGVERQASYQFFSQVLRNRKDLAFLISFDVNVELLQDLTDSAKLLSAGLENLEIQGSSGGLGPAPIPQGRVPGTVLFDSVFLAADEIMRHQVGRKALVLISDGNDYGSRLDMPEALEAAHRSDVVVYGVRYFDREFYFQAGSLGSGGAGTLKKLARETGGSMYEVSKKRSLRDIFEEIQVELRSQYSIGYTPKRDPSEAGFRRIKLETQHKDYKVHSRNGYFPKSS